MKHAAKLKTWPCDQHEDCILLKTGKRWGHVKPELLPRIQEMADELAKNARKSDVSRS